MSVMKMTMMMVAHKYLGLILPSGDKRSFDKYEDPDSKLFRVSEDV